MRPGESPYCSQQSLPQMFCFIRKSQDPFPPVGKNRTKNPTRSAHSNQQGYSGVIINQSQKTQLRYESGVTGVKGDDKADLDLGLDIVDGVAALDLERDGLPRQRLDEDLHLAGYTTRDLELGFYGGFPRDEVAAAKPEPNEALAESTRR